jgi:hypothetical protein
MTKYVSEPIHCGVCEKELFPICRGFRNTDDNDCDIRLCKVCETKYDKRTISVLRTYSELDNVILFAKPTGRKEQSNLF